MTHDKKTESDDKAQKERFIDKARELEADESSEKFERAFKRVVPEKRSSQMSGKNH